MSRFHSLGYHVRLDCLFIYFGLQKDDFRIPKNRLESEHIDYNLLANSN